MVSFVHNKAYFRLSYLVTDCLNSVFCIGLIIAYFIINQGFNYSAQLSSITTC